MFAQELHLPGFKAARIEEGLLVEQFGEDSTCGRALLAAVIWGKYVSALVPIDQERSASARIPGQAL